MEQDPKKVAQEMFVKFMETTLKHSRICVPQPLPLVEEKAAKRLNTDDLISWKVILKEWEKVSPEGKKEISLLLTLNSYDLIECLNIKDKLADEAKDTGDYVHQHPEFGKTDEEMESQDVIGDFKSMLGI